MQILFYSSLNGKKKEFRNVVLYFSFNKEKIKKIVLLNGYTWTLPETL